MVDGETIVRKPGVEKRIVGEKTGGDDLCTTAGCEGGSVCADKRGEVEGEGVVGVVVGHKANTRTLAGFVSTRQSGADSHDVISLLYPPFLLLILSILPSIRHVKVQSAF